MVDPQPNPFSRPPSDFEPESEAPEVPEEGDVQSAGEQEEVEALRAKVAELNEQLLRAAAEFQNLRRRTEQDKAQFRLYAIESLAGDLIEVLDNFERTLHAVESGASRENLVEGLKAVDRQFRSILEGRGVKRIDAVGQPFDPELHEAIAVVDGGGAGSQVVIDEVEPGYVINDRVLRASKVRVSK
jgi:molecular chaperone GrpE